MKNVGKEFLEETIKKLTNAGFSLSDLFAIKTDVLYYLLFLYQDKKMDFSTLFVFIELFSLKYNTLVFESYEINDYIDKCLSYSNKYGVNLTYFDTLYSELCSRRQYKNYSLFVSKKRDEIAELELERDNLQDVLNCNKSNYNNKSLKKLTRDKKKEIHFINKKINIQNKIDEYMSEAIKYNRLLFRRENYDGFFTNLKTSYFFASCGLKFGLEAISFSTKLKIFCLILFCTILNVFCFSVALDVTLTVFINIALFPMYFFVNLILTDSFFKGDRIEKYYDVVWLKNVKDVYLKNNQLSERVLKDLDVSDDNLDNVLSLEEKIEAISYEIKSKKDEYEECLKLKKEYLIEEQKYRLKSEELERETALDKSYSDVNVSKTIVKKLGGK